MIVRTLPSEFPHYGVVTLLGGVDTVLLASNKPLIPTATDIAALQTIVNGTPAISADLNTSLADPNCRGCWCRIINWAKTS